MRISPYLSGLPLAATVAIVSVISADSLYAQGGPAELQRNAVEAMEKGDWNEALGFLDRAIRAFGHRAASLGIGDKFGWFWYQKGVCQASLQQYKEAIATLEEGIKKYPGPQNEYINVSYLKIAEVAIALNDYDLATTYLDKFIKFRTETPQNSLNTVDRGVNLGLVYALAAQCKFKSSKSSFEDGLKDINLVAKNRYKGQGISDTPIVQAFIALADRAIAENKPEVVLEYLKTGRSIVAVEEWRMPAFLGLFLNASNKALVKARTLEGQKATDMFKVAQELQNLAPSINAVKQSLKDVSDHLGPLASISDTNLSYNKEAIKKINEGLEASLAKSSESPEAIKLMFSGAQLMQTGAYRQAQAVYRLLKENYPDLSPSAKEDILFSLIVAGANLGQMTENQALVKEFLKAYPNSEKAKSLNRMSLGNYLEEQRYDEALALAQEILKQEVVEQEIRDLARFAEGFSLFNLKRFKEAIPVFEKFTQDYQDSPFLPQVMYFLAQSHARLGNPERAAHAYGRLISRFPDKEQNPFLAYAHLERGIAFSNSNSEDDKKKAVEDFDVIIKDFPEFVLYPMAFVSKGIALERLDQRDKALESYKQGIEAASKPENPQPNVKAEALYRITALLVGERREKEAADYYETYYKEFAKDPKTPYRLETAVAGLDALTPTGRSEEGLKRLGEMIVSVGQTDPENPLVESAITNYTRDYTLSILNPETKQLDLDKAKAHFTNFPGVTANDPILSTMLRMALIGIYEEQIKKLDKQDTARRAEVEAQIKVLFDDIQKSFKLSDLTPYTLARIANNMLQRSSDTTAAIPYYEEILKRGNAAEKYRQDAEFGLAQALGESKNPANIDKAIAMMEKAIVDGRANPKQDAKTLERAEYNLAKFYFLKGDYEKAASLAFKYLGDQNNKAYRMDASTIWAQSQDKQNKVNDAIIGYQRITANYTGAIAHSAPAMKRQMELFYQRNNAKPDLDSPSDRLLAYLTGSRYIKLTQPMLEKMTVDERNAWREVEALVQRYGAEPEIMDEEKVAAERARIKSGERR